MMDLKSFNKKYLEEYKETLSNLDISKIDNLYQWIKIARDKRNNIFVLGNGGSAASASHWVCDFNKGTNTANSTRLKMMCLSDNIPTFSALGNDISYEDVFVEQLKNYLSPNDLVIGLSVSGNSENVVRALQYAQQKNAKTFSIIGNTKGSMYNYSDDSLVVDSSNYGIVEDVHMYVCHVLSQFMYEENKINIL